MWRLCNETPWELIPRGSASCGIASPTLQLVLAVVALAGVARDVSVQHLAVLRSRIVLVGCEATVLDKGGIVDQLEAGWRVDSRESCTRTGSSPMQALPFKEADETCRRPSACQNRFYICDRVAPGCFRMAAGILACLSMKPQHSSQCQQLQLTTSHAF